MQDMSAADRAANEIRGKILTNTLKPGEHINIDSFSRESGFSKTPIREALKKLVVEGLAIYTPKVGYSVRNLTLHEYLQVSEIHQSMELYLVRKLAQSPFLVDFEKMEKINDDLKKYIEENNLEMIAKTNDLFHRELYRNYPNQLMIEKMNALFKEVRSLRNLMYANKNFTRATPSDHAAILAAIKNESPDAAAGAMNRHYMNARESAIIYFPRS